MGGLSGKPVSLDVAAQGVVVSESLAVTGRVRQTDRDTVVE